MQYGLISGILWAIDTVILGVALGMTPYLDAPQASIVSACVHDVFAALILDIHGCPRTLERYRFCFKNEKRKGGYAWGAARRPHRYERISCGHQ